MASNLPVIDLLNNLITINNYLIASQAAQLPKSIASDPGNQTLVQKFVQWQRRIWGAYYASLLNEQIKAQAEEIQSLFKYDAATQEAIQGIVMESGEPIPIVVEDCVDLASLISDGQPIVTQLETVAKAIQSVDKAKLAIITEKVAALNTQFDQDEEQITKGSLQTAQDIIASGIDVGIAVASEGEAIGPLLKGVTKVGTDVITEIALTEDSKRVLGELIDAWAELDKDTADYAQITMVIAQLDNVVKQESTALTALASVKSEWSEVTDVINGSAHDWANGGAKAVDEWSALMVRVSFNAASQMLTKKDAV